jgi:hypothetical protein
MTRGNKRDIDRERAKNRHEKNVGNSEHKREGVKFAGVNKDAEALQAKVQAKQKLVEEGVIEAPSKPKEKKPANLVNPHTGKRDPEYTAKMLSKGG